jgi:hypothetical protein
MEENHMQIDSGSQHKEGSADDYGTLVFFSENNRIVEVDVGGQSQSFGYKGDKARANTRSVLRTIFGISTNIR